MISLYTYRLSSEVKFKIIARRPFQERSDVFIKAIALSFKATSASGAALGTVQSGRAVGSHCFKGLYCAGLGRDYRPSCRRADEA
jgi:hypothetical protein